LFNNFIKLFLIQQPKPEKANSQNKKSNQRMRKKAISICGGSKVDSLISRPKDISLNIPKVKEKF